MEPHRCSADVSIQAKAPPPCVCCLLCLVIPYLIAGRNTRHIPRLACYPTRPSHHTHGTVSTSTFVSYPLFLLRPAYNICSHRALQTTCDVLRSRLWRFGSSFASRNTFVGRCNLPLLDFGWHRQPYAQHQKPDAITNHFFVT